jgi:hypothetical protein
VGEAIRFSSGFRISNCLYFITCAAEFTPAANCRCGRLDIARRCL